MRSILSISVPEKLKKQIELAAKQGGYATKSEFLRAVLRYWDEQQILRDVKQSKKEFAQGKGKILKSLKDLR